MRRKRQNSVSIRASQGPLPDKNKPLLRNTPIVLDEMQQGVRTSAKIVVVIGQIRALADQPDRETALKPTLANARVQNRRLLRGLAPTISSASASSIPAIVALKRI